MTQNPIKISVIIPVYNVAPLLTECLDTVLNQTLQEIEVILIDDGSLDNSGKLCDEYAQKDKRVKVIHKKNEGAAIARNTGLNIAAGEYIKFLDADDFFELNMLDLMWRKAVATHSDIVVCKAFNFDTKTKELSENPFILQNQLLPSKNVFCWQDCAEYFFQLFSGEVWGKLFKKSFLYAHKITFPALQIAEDQVFVFSALLLAQRISVVNKQLIYYRTNQENSLMGNKEKYYKNNFESFLFLQNFIRKHFSSALLYSSFVSRCFFTLPYLTQLRYPIKSFAEKYISKEFTQHLDFFTFERFSKNKKAHSFLQNLIYKKNYSPVLENLFYSDITKIVPVVFTTDTNFAPYTAIAIESVIAHMNPKRFYDIYVAHTDLSDDIQQKLEQLSNPQQFRVTCVSLLEKIPQNIKLYQQGRFSPAAFYRFFMPDMFYGYDKILYLDSDILVQEDVANLFDTPINKNVLGACKCILNKNYKKQITKKLNLNPNFYINSGILLINVHAWKKSKVKDAFLEFIQSGKHFIAPDQDFLNMFFENSIYFLPDKWNVRWDVKINPAFFDAQDIELTDTLLKKPSIIHFISSKKPWNTENILSDKWWKCARNSAFYELVLLKNKK